MARNRGKRKPKLRDLSIHPLTNEEQQSLIAALTAATSPISVAILGAVLVEHELDASLRKSLRVADDEAWESMVDEQGPLSTFFRKISLGHVLRLYDANFEANLHIVRAVRNAFAHSKRVIDFDHELVSKELKDIKVPTRQRRPFRELSTMVPRTSYLCLCLYLVVGMIKKRNMALRRSNKRRNAALTSSPLYRALAPALGLAELPRAGSGLGALGNLLPVSQVYSRGSFLPNQSVDPSSGVPLGSPHALLHEATKNPDKKDK